MKPLPYATGQFTRLSLWFPVSLWSLVGWGLIFIPNTLSDWAGYADIGHQQLLQLIGVGMIVYSSLLAVIVLYDQKLVYPWTVIIRGFASFLLLLLFLIEGSGAFLTTAFVLLCGALLTVLGWSFDQHNGEDLP